MVPTDLPPDTLGVSLVALKEYALIKLHVDDRRTKVPFPNKDRLLNSIGLRSVDIPNRLRAADKPRRAQEKQIAKNRAVHRSIPRSVFVDTIEVTGPQKNLLNLTNPRIRSFEC